MSSMCHSFFLSKVTLDRLNLRLSYRDVYVWKEGKRLCFELTRDSPRLYNFDDYTFPPSISTFVTSTSLASLALASLSFLTNLRLQVQTVLEPFPELDSEPVLGVSSFGFGGTNAHAVLTPAPEQSPQEREHEYGPWVLLLSA